jgi:NADH-ubiquinone oxidoreductase chain 4L
MNNSIIIFISIIPLVGILNLLSNQYHFLITLLSLEGIILRLVIIVPLIISYIEAPNVSIRIILLTFGACEARLGLGLLVLISRSYGRDILNTLTSNKC